MWTSTDAPLVEASFVPTPDDLATLRRLGFEPSKAIRGNWNRYDYGISPADKIVTEGVRHGARGWHLLVFPDPTTPVSKVYYPPGGDNNLTVLLVWAQVEGLL